MDLRSVLSDDQLRSMSEGILEGKYHLLLGSGASLGATSADGSSLPTADKLIAELVDLLSLTINPGTPLPYVWEAAVAKHGTESDLRHKVTAPRFVRCRPARHHLRVPTFAWRTIFTFNVDDVAQQAYASVHARLQDPLEVHFDDSYTEPDRESDSVQLVFLHGSEVFPDKPLVFGPPAYASTVTRQLVWWHVFSDYFLSQPFIVVGATLREPDFETYIVTRRRPHLPLQPPSLFVNPSVDDAVRATCERLGLVPVPLDAASFLEQLDQLVPSRAKLSVRSAARARQISFFSAVESTPHLATLARQFVYVNEATDWPQTSGDPDAFYNGNDPTWDDIQYDRDVQVAVEAVAVERALAFVDPTKKVSRRIEVLCLEGTAGSGKTTILMRCAAALAARKARTLYLWSHERLRDDALSALAKTLKAEEGFILVVDDIADQLEQVRRFVEHFPADRGRCFILGAHRGGRKTVVRTRFIELLMPQWLEPGSLTRAEGLELAAKLRNAAKLGRFAKLTDSALARKFVRTSAEGWGGQLLVLLLEVIPGGKFRDRLRTEWNNLDRDAGQLVYGLICVSSACGVPIRVPVLLRASDAVLTDVVGAISSGPLRGLVRWTHPESLVPRHRVIAEQTVRESMSSEELFKISQRLSRAIAPYVSRATIMKRTGEARLIRQLMDANGLVVRRLGSDARVWYQEMQSDWGWNSRYWEQRALQALGEERFSEARDFAATAIGIEEHAFPFTTGALVNLGCVQSDKAIDDAERAKLFNEAIDLLHKAIKDSELRSFRDYRAYRNLFVYAREVALLLGTGEQRALDRVLTKHIDKAEKNFGREPELRSALAEFRRRERS